VAGASRSRFPSPPENPILAPPRRRRILLDRARPGPIQKPIHPPTRGLLALALLASPGALAAPDATYADWRLQVWGPITGADDAISGTDADPDLDGIRNALEFLLGLDPTRPDPSPYDSVQPVPGPALEFRFQSYDRALGASLRPEFTTDLGASWNPVDGSNLQLDPDGDPGGFASTPHLATLAAPGTAFFRLAAEVDPDATAPVDGLDYVLINAGGGGDPFTELVDDDILWINAGLSFTRSFTAPSDGTYAVWVRKRWEEHPFRWRVDDGPWTTVDVAREDVRIYNPENAGDRVGWFQSGSVELEAGSGDFEINSLHTAYSGWDAILLTEIPYLPDGENPPSTDPPPTEPGRFPFLPEPDPFTHSPIDLRHLNERFAGQHGFITTQGENFIHSDSGESVRFWAANAGAGIGALARESIDEMARHLAKRGVNLVRYHSPFWVQSGADFGDIDEDRLDDIHYLVAALRREGIYTAFSIYFPLWADLSGTSFAGYPTPGSGGRSFGTLYHDPAFQAIYRNWWTQLLTRNNPYTGRALRDEPAVAYLEMVNEDSYLFWTFKPNDDVPAEQVDILEPLFGDWAAAKYGSLANAFATWGQAEAGDDLGAGRAGFNTNLVWRATAAGPQSTRDADTVAFLADQQRAFHLETHDFLKNTLGFRGAITGSNWKTGDTRYLDPLDKWSNTVADFMDRHGYYGSSVSGEASGYDVRVGQTFHDRAAVRFQSSTGVDEGSFSHPVFDLRHDNLPSFISETDHPEPNRFRADQPFLHAAYASLQGSDGIVFFSITGPRFLGTIDKWPLQSPMTLGQFPAFASIYRRGLVEEAGSVAEFDLLVDDLKALGGAPVSAPQNFDDLRAEDIPPGDPIPDADSIDPLAFLVGKVGLNYVDQNPGSSVINLENFIDRDAKVVTSSTGQLVWDYGTGVVTMNAPAAQGATGFLDAAGPLALGDLTIDCTLEYGTVVLLSLDDRPIATSERLLLQIGTEERPTGWATSGSNPKTIDSLGGSPFQLKQIGGTLALARPDAASLTVTPLDFNGYRTSAPPLTGAAPLTLLPDVIYYLIEK